MRKTEANIIDFRHNMTREYLKSMLKVPALNKLNWLEEAHDFIKEVHSLEYLQKWREYYKERKIRKVR